MEKERVIVTSGVKLPHGMDGFNTQSGAFVRWAEGFHQPVPGLSELQPQNLFVQNKYLTWSDSGYYEMSTKNSAAYQAKVNADSGSKRTRPEVHHPQADNNRPTIKHVAFQSNLSSQYPDKVVAFEQGARVRVVGGLHSGIIGTVQGPVHNNPSCYVVRSSDTPAQVVHVSYLHLCHHRAVVDLTNHQSERPAARSATPGDDFLNQVSDSSISAPAQQVQPQAQSRRASKRMTWQRQEAQLLHNCPLVPGMQQYPQRPPQSLHRQGPGPQYTRGFKVRVVKGTYFGCSGEVQGIARIGKKVLRGQFNVLVFAAGGEVLVMLSAEFLEPFFPKDRDPPLHSPSHSPSLPGIRPGAPSSPIYLTESSAASEMLVEPAPALAVPPHEASSPPAVEAPSRLEAEPDREPELHAEDFIGVVEMLQSEDEGEEGEENGVHRQVRGGESFFDDDPSSVLDGTASEVHPQCGLQALAQISAICADAGDLSALTGLFMFK